MTTTFIEHALNRSLKMKRWLLMYPQGKWNILVQCFTLQATEAPLIKKNQ